jgi:hypothetical protein
MMSMEATLNAEKTIAESLRGTIKQLTEAMTGVVAIKPKSQGHQNRETKRRHNCSRRICYKLKFLAPVGSSVRRSLRPSDRIWLIFPSH